MLESVAKKQGWTKSHYLRHMACLDPQLEDVPIPSVRCLSCPTEADSYTEAVMVRFSAKQIKVLKKIKRKDEGIGPLVRRLAIERITKEDGQ